MSTGQNLDATRPKALACKHGRHLTDSDVRLNGRSRLRVSDGLVGLVAAYFRVRPGHVDVHEMGGDPRSSSIALTLAERGLAPLSQIDLDCKKIATPPDARVVHAPDGSLRRLSYGYTSDQYLYWVARSGLHPLLFTAAEPNFELHFNERFTYRVERG